MPLLEAGVVLFMSSFILTALSLATSALSQAVLIYATGTGLCNL